MVNSFNSLVFHLKDEIEYKTNKKMFISDLGLLLAAGLHTSGHSQEVGGNIISKISKYTKYYTKWSIKYIWQIKSIKLLVHNVHFLEHLLMKYYVWCSKIYL